MKKEVVGIFLIMFFLVFTINFIIADNEASVGNSDNENQIVGGCGTVTPGLENECCKNLGYDKWDSEKNECIGNQTQQRERIVAANQIQARKLTAAQVQKAVAVRNRLEIRERLNQSECPNNCTCSGSTIKCKYEGANSTQREMIIRAGQSGNTIVQVKNVNASTKVVLYKSEEGKVVAVFRNNETHEILMPDEIRERIVQRERKRIHLEDENITLREDGKYEIHARKRARLLWIIPVQERVNAQVDAETGEILRQRNSWWGFLARDVRSEEQ